MTKQDELELSINFIKDALDERKFNDLIGMVENDVFDAKEGLPDLKKDAMKTEFAKDVSALINAHGGYLIYGLTTDKSENHIGEKVKEISGIKKTNIKRLKDILINKIYPDITPFVIIQEYTLENGEQLLVISVNKGHSLCVVKSTQLLDNQTSTLNFGIFRRQFDQSEPIQIEDFYNNLDFAGTLGRIDSKLELLNENMSRLLSKGMVETDKKSISDEEYKTRIDHVLKKHRFINTRSIILTANFTPLAQDIEGLFSGSRNAFQLVKEPPHYRRMGWDLQTLDEPKIKGEYLEAKSGEVKVFRVYRDGFVIFGCLADPSFLAFGLEANEESGQPMLRALAVAELIASFAQFIEMLRVFLQPQPERVDIGIIFNNPEKQKVQLVKGFLNQFDHSFKDYINEKEQSTKNFDFNNEDGFNWEYIAYKTYSELAFMFGVEEDKLWFVKDRKIDITSFGDK